MVAKDNFIETPAGMELVITRVFDAPRELVFRAWTDPELIKKWWGPRGWTLPVCKVNPVPGGETLVCMRGEGGFDIWCGGIYLEIVFPEKIVCTDYFADADGNKVPATHYGMGADFPLEMLIMVTFEDFEGKTRLTMRHSGLPATPEGEGADEGWSQMFDKLAEMLAEK